MDAKTRNLVLLGSLSLCRAGVAWILDHFVVGCGFWRSVQPPLSA